MSSFQTPATMGSCMLKGCTVKMGKGAQVIVSAASGKPSLTLDGNTLEGCDYMWRSILVGNKGKLIATGNTFYDAQWAIRVAPEGANFSITGNTFKRNFVGFYADAPESITGYMNNLGFTGNQFLHDDLPFKQAYGPASPNDPAGQWPAPGSREFAGVVLVNNAGLDIGANNVFNKLRNGIVALNSVFKADDCDFTNMVSSPGTAAGIWNLNNYGVYAEKCLDARVLNSDFIEIEFGIHAVESSLRAENNNLLGNPVANADNSDAAIRCQFGTLQSIRIYNNEISYPAIAIDVNDCLPALDLKINNNIVVPRPGNLYPQIQLVNARANTRGWISGNRVQNSDANTYCMGLYMLNCKGFNVLENDFYDTYTGVGTDGNMENYFYGNRVSHEPGSGNPLNTLGTGFAIQHSTANYCDNQTRNQLFNGFSFNGACNPSDFGCNYMEGIGVDALFLQGPVTKIGTQYNKGNSWMGNFRDAFNGTSTNIIDIQLSQFTIPNTQSVNWAAALPNSDWFRPLAISFPNCNTCPVPVDTDEDPRGDEGDASTARGDDSDQTFRWMARQRLYDRLSRKPSLADSDSDVLNFYQTSQGNDLGRLYNIAGDLNKLQGREPWTRRQLLLQSDILSEIQNTRTALLQAGPTSNPLGWESQLHLINKQSAQRSAILNAHLKWLEEQGMNEVPALQSSNDNVNNTLLAAQNEKELNTLFLSNQLWENGVVPSSVLAQVKAIADQCPNEGGFPVYKARGIYLRYHPGYRWDNTLLCGTVDKEHKTERKSAPALVIRPNPASESFVLEFPGNNIHDAQFTLYDNTSRVVLQQGLTDHSNSYLIDCGTLTEGLYHYAVEQNGVVSYRGKLLIVH